MKEEAKQKHGEQEIKEEYKERLLRSTNNRSWD